MNTLLEILWNILAAFITWPERDEPRSIMGESKYDRSARWIKTILISVMVLLIVGFGVWLYLRG